MRIKETTTNKIIMSAFVVSALAYIILTIFYGASYYDLITFIPLLTGVILAFYLFDEDFNVIDLTEFKKKIDEKQKSLPTFQYYIVIYHSLRNLNLLRNSI